MRMLAFNSKISRPRVSILARRFSGSRARSLIYVTVRAGDNPGRIRKLYRTMPGASLYLLMPTGPSGS